MKVPLNQQNPPLNKTYNPDDYPSKKPFSYTSTLPFRLKKSNESGLKNVEGKVEEKAKETAKEVKEFIKNFEESTMDKVLIVFMLLLHVTVLAQSMVTVIKYNDMKNNPDSYIDNTISETVYLMSVFSIGLFSIFAFVFTFMLYQKFTNKTIFDTSTYIIFSLMALYSISFGSIAVNDTMSKNKLSDITTVAGLNIGVSSILLIALIVLVLHKNYASLVSGYGATVSSVKGKINKPFADFSNIKLDVGSASI